LKLYVVGTGPGAVSEITPRARIAIENCEVVAGYSLYIDLIRELLDGKEIISTGMTGEAGRCRAAIHAALDGKSVCVVSGGDAGVYGMAGLILELAAPHPRLEVEVIPGVTAACSTSAALGAPLTRDFVAISLSDRLTDWGAIEKRLRSAAQADFVICLYNPASRARKSHLKRACEIILEHRAPQTPCGIARNIGRDGGYSQVMTLAGLAVYEADMFTTIVVGNSETRIINGRLVTPRGYKL
jgi:precorrin-3B C17-methyltransferase